MSKFVWTADDKLEYTLNGAHKSEEERARFARVAAKFDFDDDDDEEEDEEPSTDSD